MSVSFASLQTTLIGVVQGSPLVDDGQVYAYEQPGFGGYPAVTVTPSEQRSTFADFSRNERHYFFDIKCYQERLEAGWAAAEATLIGLMDDLIVRFDGDLTIGGALTGLGYMRPVQVKWAYTKAPDAELRLAILTVEVVTIQ